MRVKPNEFSAAVGLELETYGEDVRKGVAQIVAQVAEQCVRRLRRTSPKRTGDYAKAWKKTKPSATGPSASTVYNDEKYQISHLLENGYQSKNGGRVPGQPHIDPAAQEAAQSLTAKITQFLQEGTP